MPGAIWQHLRYAEAGAVLGLLDESEFTRNLVLQAARDVKPASDHYLAVFVFSAEPLEDGTRALRIISTTVVGIQRYTTTRLRYQGIYPTQASGDSLLVETSGMPHEILLCGLCGRTATLTRFWVSHWFDQ